MRWNPLFANVGAPTSFDLQCQLRCARSQLTILSFFLQEGAASLDSLFVSILDFWIDCTVQFICSMNELSLSRKWIDKKAESMVGNFFIVVHLSVNGYLVLCLHDLRMSAHMEVYYDTQTRPYPSPNGDYAPLSPRFPFPRSFYAFPIFIAIPIVGLLSLLGCCFSDI